MMDPKEKRKYVRREDIPPDQAKRIGEKLEKISARHYRYYPCLRPKIGVIRGQYGGFLLKGELPKSAPIHDRLMSLSLPGSAVLYRCDGTKTFRDIVEDICKSSGQPMKLVRPEAERMVIGAVNAGFVKLQQRSAKTKAVVLDATGGAVSIPFSSEAPYIEGLYGQWCSACAGCAICSACTSCGACLVTPPPVIDFEVAGIIMLDGVLGVAGVAKVF